MQQPAYRTDMLGAALHTLPCLLPILSIPPNPPRAQAVQQWLPPHLQPAPADLWQVGAVTDWDRLAAAAGIEPGSDHEEYPRGGGRAGGGGRLRPHIAVVSYDLATKIAPQHASRCGGWGLGAGGWGRTQWEEAPEGARKPGMGCVCGCVRVSVRGKKHV